MDLPNRLLTQAIPLPLQSEQRVNPGWNSALHSGQNMIGIVQHNDSLCQCLTNAASQHAYRTHEVLAEGLGIEVGKSVIFYGKADLDWLAAYLAVFDVGLAADG